MIDFINPYYNSDLVRLLVNQVKKKNIGPGKLTREIEKYLTVKFGVKRVLFTTSGSVSLYIAAKVLGLKKNDEIIIPAYGVICNANAFVHAGLNIKLVEINLKTGCIDPLSLKKSITKKTKAVCFVNFSGYVGQDLNEIRSICQKKKLKLIEDSACGFGNKYKGKYSGTTGDISIFSFSPAKIITCGQGGLIFFKKEKYYKKALELIDQGANNWRVHNDHKKIGLNFRFNDILAAYLKKQIINIDKITKHKASIFNLLSKDLRKYFYKNLSTYTLYNIVFSKNRKKLMLKLQEEKIDSKIQYKRINQNTYYKNLQKKALFKNSHFWEKNALFLPSGTAMSKQQAFKINKVLKSNINLLYPL
jgi:perosamine synthetase